MTQHDLDLLRKVTADYKSVNSEVVKMILADNARLRALIKEAEWPDYPDKCPWCFGGCGSGTHSSDCEAFTPSGKVR